MVTPSYHKQLYQVVHDRSTNSSNNEKPSHNSWFTFCKIYINKKKTNNKIFI